MQVSRIGQFICLLVPLFSGVPFLLATPAEDFAKTHQPVLKKYCYECHGPDKKKGDLDLSIYTDYEKMVMVPEVWRTVMERVQAFEMPPEGKKDMGFDTRKNLVNFLKSLPQPKKPDCEEIASDRNAGYYQGYVMSRPLNRAEYNNTVRDLFGVDLQLEQSLPADGGGGEGFDTSGNALFVSAIHIESYLEIADRIVESILPDKTRGQKSEQVEARKRLLIAKPTLFKPAREAATVVLKEFLPRAYRRPVTGEELEKILSMFDRAQKRGDGYVASMRLALKAALISPNFLFLVEPESPKGGIVALAPHPLINRLSYFLWSSMPDQELMRLADTGEILDEKIYRAQVQRMLRDQKAEALGKRFAMQWLDLEKLGSEVKPDPEKFPEFTPELKWAMVTEVTTYFNHIIKNDRPLTELIESRYTFLNRDLAKLYGVRLENQTGAEFQEISLINSNRGGILTMPAVHALTSFPGRTSPVLRGRWVLEAFLGEKVPPPPPDVPALEESSSSGEVKLSLREQLEKHRSKPDCIGCHKKMDPLGFGLENFDVLGRWRTEDKGQPIEASGTLPNGESFSGPAELKAVLLKRKNDIMKHLSRKMTGYAFGRELTRYDDCVIDRAVKALEQNEYRASHLVEQIAISFPFRHRFYSKIESVAEVDGAKEPLN